MKKQQEEKDISDNIISLDQARLKFAIKEPPDGGNWLSKLPVGTRFLASLKNMNGSKLYDFLVASDPTKMPAVLLGVDLGNRGGFEWHDPVRFSQGYNHYMNIETETEDGSTPIQTGRVEGDGTSEDPDSLHEAE